MLETKSRKWATILAILIAGFTIFLVPVDDASSEETYEFERMWPTLQQPWYFNTTAVAVDGNGNVYVANWSYYTIKKFTSSGQFVTEWGVPGDYGGGEPFGLGIDRNGYIYVAGAGASGGAGQCVLKFTLDGQFISKWGTEGTGQGEFRNPQGIAVDDAGNVYVVDVLNNRIQKFSAANQFVAEWGTAGSGDGQFAVPTDIAIDQNGYLYVVDSGNSRIQKFTQDGSFVSKWGSSGSGDGEFDFPDTGYTWMEGGLFCGNITIDREGNIYVIDYGNNRIQIFNSDGQFLSKWTNIWARGIAAGDNGNIYVGQGGYVTTYDANGEDLISWGSSGSGVGEFNWPGGISIDGNGNVFVADSGNSRIQKFAANGTFLTSWYSASLQGLTMNGNGDLYGVDPWGKSVYGFTPDGELIGTWKYNSSATEEFFPTGIAIDATGNIYIADYEDYCIKKFSTQGQLILQWGRMGSDDGEFNFERYNGPDGIGIETDAEGYIYVADLGNNRVQKFTLDGTFVLKWGSEGQGDGKFYYPRGIAVDKNHDVYVVDKYYIQKFTSNGTFLDSYCLNDGGPGGSAPGIFNGPVDLVVSDEEKIYVVDQGNNRIQVLSSDVGNLPETSKVIIVAGGGPYQGNNLWDATQMCTNFAYRALTYQGFTKDSIYYLSSDTDLDLDGNGELDDVDADATNANLQTAITSWATDASDLTIYITDHGGDQNFRMGEIELLTAQELNTWLNQLQAATNVKVIIIYDACESGSFLAELASTVYDRIFIASTSQDQQAYFTSMGQISFSYFFWGNIFNGMSLYDAYLLSQDAVEYAYSLQTPLLNADGNDTGNEDSDMDLIQGINIGNGVVSADDIPVIGSISNITTLNGETQATIYADNVIDANGISRVWAIITPPDDGTADSSDPVLNLPEIQLTNTSGTLYEGTYDGFTQNGTYNVAVFAMDTRSMLSIPKSTQVIQTAGQSYSTLNSDLKVSLPCIEVQDVCYQLTLEYYSNPSDTLNLFWKLDSNSIGINQSCGSDCASMDLNFQITIPKIEFEGNFYQVVLNKYNNPVDFFNLYWMLDLASIQAL